MIDIHFHCLPGIDDGARDWDDAVALCKAAYAEGTTTIIATPHVLREPWLNEDPEQRESLRAELNDRLSGQPRILPGCEYYFSADAIELWEKGKGGVLTPLNDSSYLLIEFPATRIPDGAEAVFHEFSVIGVTPVIAHPERNLVFAEDPDRLSRLVELGGVGQITAGSLIGAFGPAALEACAEFFDRGLIYFVASDVHSLDRRPPQLAAAREAVRARWGPEAETALFESNPAALIANAPLPWP